MDVDEPLVSIIMPAYNAGKTITQSINSVLNQTYKNWELIVIDDCSVDNTKEIVQKYSNDDQRIYLVISSNNSGVVQARNKGLSLCTGRYIAFLDSDDIWDYSKLTKQIDFMRKNNYAFSFSSYKRFNDVTNKEINIVKAPPIMCAEDILKNTVIGCLTVVVNREIVGDFAMPNLNHSEDQCTWIYILKRGYKAYGIQETLAYYRVGNKSLTQNKLQSAKKQWKVYRKYHGLSLFKSTYYFFCYVLNVLKR